MCNNASPIKPMVVKFGVQFTKDIKQAFNAKKCQIWLVPYIFSCFRTKVNLPHRCMAHIISLTTQAMILAQSKAKHYDSHNEEQHIPDLNGADHDELGLVQAISVKVHFLTLEF